MNEFDKVIGYENIKMELTRICDIIKNPGKYERLGVTLPKGILLYGVPGVGKSLLADCFMKECDMKSHVCRKNKPNEEFVNFLKSTFDEARKEQPSIILLDDMDKFANEDSDHPDAEEYVTIQSCIDEVKNDQVFVIATANDIRKVPKSLIRAGRFDKAIRVDLPKEQEALKIIQYYLCKKEYTEDVDAAELARYLQGRSCAELASVINEAGIHAGFAGKEKIEMEDMIKACLRLLYEAPESLPDGGHLDDEETAYHEAGHLVVGEVLEPGSVSLLSIGGYEGDTSGFVAYYRSPDYWRSFQLMKIRVLVLLAGKAEVELKYGRADTGSFSDISRAENVIRRMITEYGLLGFDKYNADEKGYDNSPQLQARIEDSMFDELEKCYKEAKEILCKNREFVEKIAQAAKEKKLLTRKEIQEIKWTCKIHR